MIGKTEYPRVHKIQAHASEDEFRAWKAIARHDRRKPAEVLRALVRQRALELGLWPSRSGKEASRSRTGC